MKDNQSQSVTVIIELDADIAAFFDAHYPTQEAINNAVNDILRRYIQDQEKLA